jgi:hypothetical protein
MLRYRFQLQDRALGAFAGPSVTGTGGKAIVCAAGSQAKATLYDSAGAALANPISLTLGAGTFHTANTVTAVDIFILTGEGYSAQLWSVGPDELHEVPIDRSNLHQMLVLPISVADQVTNNTEVDTGLDLIAGMVMETWPHIKVVTEDATETVDVGTGEAVPADGGDSDGYISAAALDTAGLVKDVNGAYISSIVTHIALPDSLTWKMSDGANTATLYAFLPYWLMLTGTPTITS